MLLIGSRALVHNNPELADTRKCVDWDYICTIDQFSAWYKANKTTLQFAVPTQGGKYYHARGKDGMNFEFEIAWEGTSAHMLLNSYHALEVNQEPIVAINDDLLLIKMSHRYKKDSPHFLKTMRDIEFLREVVGEQRVDHWPKLSCNAELIKIREAESYTYSHPKLNVNKGAFFTGDGVDYVYDHDEIHTVVAVESSPAYMKYADGEVWSSKENFFKCDEQTRLYGVYEESCVLALERSQIPHGLGKEGGPTARWSFEMALMKVSTSITSGFFREYAWEHYSEVMALYNELGEEDYIERFKRNQHLLKPYVG